MKQPDDFNNEETGLSVRDVGSGFVTQTLADMQEQGHAAVEDVALRPVINSILGNVQPQIRRLNHIQKDLGPFMEELDRARTVDRQRWIVTQAFKNADVPKYGPRGREFLIDHFVHNDIPLGLRHIRQRQEKRTAPGVNSFFIALMLLDAQTRNDFINGMAVLMSNIHVDSAFHYGGDVGISQEKPLRDRLQISFAIQKKISWRTRLAYRFARLLRRIEELRDIEGQVTFNESAGRVLLDELTVVSEYFERCADWRQSHRVSADELLGTKFRALGLTAEELEPNSYQQYLLLSERSLRELLLLLYPVLVKLSSVKPHERAGFEHPYQELVTIQDRFEAAGY